MNNVFQLVFIREAAEDISYSDINNILEASRTNNKQENVTGVLIFRDGYFVQLLEGLEPNVRKVFSQSVIDDHASSAKILVETSGTQRLFESSSMAFCDGDISSNSTEDLSLLFGACLGTAEDKNNQIMPLFKKFSASISVLR